MKDIGTLNPENASDEEIKTYRIREAARAVVFDDNDNIALLHVSKKNYYKLPGGGIEESEDKLTALQRECLEEVGCAIEVLGEVGVLTEHRKMFNIEQISYCYVAKVQGEKGIPEFTQDELTDNFKLEWLPANEALKVIKESKTDDLEGSLYIVPRDTAILKAITESLRQLETK